MIIVFDIDGVVRDVGNSYRRALADTVEEFTLGGYRPTPEDIDRLKSEGIWNNDWEGSQELIYRYFESQGKIRDEIELNYAAIVEFFQSRYRGTDGENFNGYITTEPLLLQAKYLETLSENGIAWGFFSGATRGSAEYVLSGRLGLENPVLIAMEDAPGKPDPTGLFETVKQLEIKHNLAANSPVFYAGDTVADMYTVEKAKALQPRRTWIGIGILPPHVQSSPERKESYAEQLKQAGATIVLGNVQELNSERVHQLI
ncbi:TIGR01548 family HAD-type hydrolase [Spirulina sp. 06S082]|uniref:TIGR01548 family HAD-type hydrolase n=1 Tax=Spirulina sp. 06S082 TaxID=3110248 RepID=UPI002B21EB84|nr:TIGR01548 family HAD-type hydrolase [Spirulina sp. 06S082]MEA5471700.1 TIGR01548 family HAD-type hydrolase [Spirulina sp. 06S082]